jgi:hypothetical protein
MRIAVPLVLFALLAACATPGGRKPDWTAFADCAGAYRANAAIADPSRPASMTAMVSEVADDYEKAARARHGGDPETAARDVSARSAAKTRTFAGRPREAAEQFIEACPQTE